MGRGGSGERHGPPDRRGRELLAPARLALRERGKDPDAIRPWLVRDMALGSRLVHPAAVLRPALAAMERPPGAAFRPGGAALLHLQHRSLSAGRHLPGGAADPVG